MYEYLIYYEDKRGAGFLVTLLADSTRQAYDLFRQQHPEAVYCDCGLASAA
ncbi:response regulator [Hymenobacter guriensis]|uniref:Transposase n=1 Tax=Hymenobacter guriensis TaxID=2793065 RepID=A0ABS0KX76_9BACT|nr:hypothetical protein [Hymenobacter guriensis]MBG8552375.1 hypothetical protein [Hymenobacter guriensis]